MSLQLQILGSSSQGNGYILTENSDKLLLECGIRANKVLQALNFEASKVGGVIVSHR